MIDILMLLQTKDDLFENFFTIENNFFRNLQLHFGSVSKKDPLCIVIRFAKFESMLVKMY